MCSSSTASPQTDLLLWSALFVLATLTAIAVFGLALFSSAAFLSSFADRVFCATIIAVDIVMMLALSCKVFLLGRDEPKLPEGHGVQDALTLGERKSIPQGELTALSRQRSPRTGSNDEMAPRAAKAYSCAAPALNPGWKERLGRISSAYLTFCHLLLPFEFVYCAVLASSVLLQVLAGVFLVGVHAQWFWRSRAKNISYFRGTGKGACVMDDYEAGIPPALAACPGFDVFVFLASFFLFGFVCLRISGVIQY